jgi:Spy/CpxP family protein refolding chaperone
MKRTVLIIVLILNLCYISHGQNQGRFNRAESIHVAYITKELDLTPAEAQKFWPVFNTYRDDIRKARQDNKDDQLAFEEKALNIRKKYKVEFKKVLTDEQRVNKLFTAELNFRQILRKELQNRRKNATDRQQ